MQLILGKNVSQLSNLMSHRTRFDA